MTIGCLRRRVLRHDPDACQEPLLLGGWNVRPEQAVDPRRPEGHAPRPRFDGRGVDAARGDGAAGPVGEQLRDAVGADPGQPDLLALLEAQARLGPSA